MNGALKSQKILFLLFIVLSYFQQIAPAQAQPMNNIVLPSAVKGGTIATDVAIGSGANGAVMCYLTSSKAVRCAGAQGSNRSGDGVTLGSGNLLYSRTSPATVIGLKSRVSSFSYGSDHGCAVLTNGGIKCWGSQDSGQLGDAGAQGAERDSAVTAYGVSGATKVSTDQLHSCAIVSNGANSGAVKCWGFNNTGGLGDGTTTTKSTPTLVTNLTGGVGNAVTDILVTNSGSSPQQTHSYAIKEGTLFGWGGNATSRLGVGADTTNRTTPVPLPWPAGSSAAQKIACRTVRQDNMCCAITVNGGLNCWGYNRTTQSWVGVDNTVELVMPTPVPVVGLSDGSGLTVSKVALAEAHSCAIASGALYCWGSNRAAGAVGNNATNVVKTPIPITGFGTGVTDVDVSANDNTCVVKDGAVWCWGYNGDGVLLTGDTVLRKTPVPIAQLSSGASIAQIVGDKHYSSNNSNFSLGFCARSTTGKVYCWGSGSHYGWTGSGRALSGKSHLAKEVPMPAGWTLSSTVDSYMSPEFFCAALTSGTDTKPYCWGLNSVSRLGTGDTTTRQTLTPVGNANMTALTKLALPYGINNYACAINGSGNGRRGYCWGTNTNGLAGQATTSGSVTTPTILSGMSNITLSDIKAGESNTCALDTGGALYCWGANGTVGRNGNNSTAVTTTATVATNLSSGVTDFDVGSDHSCAIKDDAGTPKVYCWGTNTNGQIGVGDTTHRLTPTLVLGLSTAGHGYDSVKVSSLNTCVVNSSNGTVRCWGTDSNGTLGDGGTTAVTNSSPVAVSFLTATTKLSLNHTSACALQSDGKLYCWGRGTYGNVGNNSTSDASQPVHVSTLGSLVTDVYKSGYFTYCALTSTDSGKLWCWGWQDIGQFSHLSHLGTGMPGNLLTPVPVIGLSSNVAKYFESSITSNSAYKTSHCVRKTDNSLWCFGTNGSGTTWESLSLGSTLQTRISVETVFGLGN